MIRRIAVPLIAGLLATVTACAAPMPQASTSSASGAASAPPSSPSCTAHAVAGDSASGSTVCVALGGDLTVLLHATAGGSWSTPEVTGTALGPAQPVPTPAGSAGWSFAAAAAGTAVISASRPVCPSAAPGAVRCHSVAAYVLHVDVA
jgi:hypothetical protein